MEYTKTISPEEFMEDLEKDSENGKTYEQLNAEHSYVAYVQTKEMVSTIKELGDEDDVNTAINLICNIAERFNINIPPGILDILGIYEYLYVAAHTSNDVFLQIKESLSSIYFDVLCNYLNYHHSFVISSMKTSGIDEEKVKEIVKNFFICLKSFVNL